MRTKTKLYLLLGLCGIALLALILCLRSNLTQPLDALHSKPHARWFANGLPP